MSTFNNQVSDTNAGIMTTVSAGSLYNNQILFLPSVSSSLTQNIDYSSLVPLHPEMIPFANDNGVDVNDVLLKQVSPSINDDLDISLCVCLGGILLQRGEPAQGHLSAFSHGLQGLGVTDGHCWIQENRQFRN